MRPLAKASLVALLLTLLSCGNAHNAVTRTAAIAEPPWTCEETQTQVVEITEAKYRLTGCGQTTIYDCNFAFQPPRCWR